MRRKERARAPWRTTVESLLGLSGLSPSNTVSSTLILTPMRGEFIIRKQTGSTKCGHKWIQLSFHVNRRRSCEQLSLCRREQITVNLDLLQPQSHKIKQIIGASRPSTDPIQCSLLPPQPLRGVSHCTLIILQCWFPFRKGKMCLISSFSLSKYTYIMHVQFIIIVGTKTKIWNGINSFWKVQHDKSTRMD